MPAQPWEPQYWFLTSLDQQRYIDPDSGAIRLLGAETLLGARLTAWMEHNRKGFGSLAAAPAWNLNTPTVPLLALYTSNNLVTPLIDGKTYMTDLDGRLSPAATVRPDVVLMAGWDFAPGRWLDQSDQLKSQLANRLTDLAVTDSKRIIQILSWLGPPKLPIVQTRQFRDRLAAIDGGRIIYLDDRLGGFAMAHHQKVVYLGYRNPAQSVAYVGGIDLALDRWDDSAHKNRVKEDKFYDWHDIQVKVQGDVLIQLWANFAERWESVRARRGVPPVDGGPQLADCPVPVWQPSSPGKHHVQVLRTVATAPSSDPKRYLQEGERTVLAGLLKAIANAECYIYIEEQFLWYGELAHAIAEQMKAKKELRLIVVMAAKAEIPLQWGQYQYHLRSEFFRTVMRLDSKSEIVFGSASRVYAYGLYQTSPFPQSGRPYPIYVHSKLVIIDDRYVAIGSANVNRRSMHVDTELTLAIVDGDTEPGVLNGNRTTVCTFAKNFREALWREHLNVTSLDPDPITVVRTVFPPGTDFGWPRTRSEAKASGKYHLRCWVNRPGSLRGIEPDMARIIDRDDRRMRWWAAS
jgi:hypothetical protein